MWWMCMLLFAAKVSICCCHAKPTYKSILNENFTVIVNGMMHRDVLRNKQYLSPHQLGLVQRNKLEDMVLHFRFTCSKDSFVVDH
ncbi:hypothetical protein BDD12DRAFT_822550, partial [Trichophaea hybrida]